jgi:hypothetical protein
MRLSSSTRYWFVPKSELFINEGWILDGNKEPFPLPHKGFVTTAISLSMLHTQPILECSNYRWLESIESSAHRRNSSTLRYSGYEPMSLVVSTEKLVLPIVLM